MGPQGRAEHAGSFAVMVPTHRDYIARHSTSARCHMYRTPKCYPDPEWYPDYETVTPSNVKGSSA